MELTYTPEQEAFRKEARTWLEANAPREKLPSFDTKEGFEAHREWEKKLHAGGFAMVPWPVEYGGRGANLLEWLIFEEEYYRAGAPGRVNQNGIFLLGPTIMEVGTPEQKKRFLPKMASSEEVWAQGWSEPNAGSDMANIQATAIKDGDHFVINGQKTWASRGAFAHWLFGMFRSDPDSSRHKGLTFILVPLDTPGITVRPIEKLNHKKAFAEVFFDDARVPIENQLGEEGKGWDVAMATAGFERGLMLRSPARFQDTARKLVELYKQTVASGVYVAPELRDTVARCWMDAEAYTLNTYQTVSRLLAGGKIGAEASLNKIFWSELDLKMHDTALKLLGHRAELLPGAPAAGDVGEWLDGYIFALAGPIYAGTNEIQRNIIAERILGMPRK
ncbi:MAG: acyl-CoA dehydrogenase family protein [Spirochaetaceae bacterium]|nr:acyl-CoA dehydrogenase family protein [Myxococcales bacterium]MCB9722745.1 acyl-CoA dehydrogenase family protein [Spirochaetaceae bacterium]